MIFKTARPLIIRILLAGIATCSLPAVTAADCPHYGFVRLSFVDYINRATSGKPQIIVPGQSAVISIDSHFTYHIGPLLSDTHALTVFRGDTITYRSTIEIPVSDTTELVLNLELCDSIIISAVVYNEGYQQGVFEAECEIVQARPTMYGLHSIHGLYSRKPAPGYDTVTGLRITRLPPIPKLQAQGIITGHNNRIIEFMTEQAGQAHSRRRWNNVIARPIESFFELSQRVEPFQLPFKGEYIKSPDGEFSVRLDVSEIDSIVELSLYVKSHYGVSYCSHQAFWDFPIELVWGPPDADIAFLRWGKGPNVACKRGFASYTTLDLRSGGLLATVKGEWLAPVP